MTYRIYMMTLLATFALACGDDSSPPPVDGGNMDTTPPVDAGQDTGIDGGPCVDNDSDGYGEGCAPGPDCNDADENVNPAASEVCDGVDNDCSDVVDDNLTDAPSCTLMEGVCAGATATCGGVDGYLECGATEYGATYEADETLCDGMDNDCNGSTDEGCSCTDGMMQACGSDVGACMEGTQTCVDSAWGPCDGEVGPMGEVCDGMDNDCDGMDDDAGDLMAPACPLQLGVCAGTARSCGGAAGWIACSGIESYGGDYEAAETLCDGLDNDCDGVTDEGCECVDGTMQACGTDIGACMAGVQTCTAGAFGACAGEVVPVDEACDGVDNDCDGMVDDDLVAPACALQMGICAGSAQPCNGAAGFEACAAADYGPSYEADETACDGQDNDCDGTIDEGCDCVDGTTQDCGLSTGVCERGTQTCVSGMFGACTGGVEPAIEICNGADDDCNGLSDDNLVAPDCALTEGVCAGTTQSCAGASGWGACVPADYGPDYVADEDGAGMEGVCDGLDNDCDGTADEGCVTFPVLTDPLDLVLPDLHNQSIVYMQNFDGNWDIVFADFNTGTTRRLTTTAVDEVNPKVYGNYAAWVRGGAVNTVVIYDLVTDTETAITTIESGSPDLAGGTLVYDEFDGTQWDVFLYDIGTATSSNLFTGGTAEDEIRPSIRGSRIAYVSSISGEFITEMVDFAAMTPTVVAQTPAASAAAGQLNPILDYTTIGWTDGRDVTAAVPDGMSNWQVYGAAFTGTTDLYPGELAVDASVGAQILTDIDGSIFVWSDMGNGNWDPTFAAFGSAPTLLSTHPGTQADPTISGAVILWEDNRRGTFDIYGTQLGGFPVPGAGEVVINEFLADPATGADPNGDGVSSTTQDEFVEIINTRTIAFDVSGATISDAVRVRHTIADGTVIPAGGALIVFGGGTLAGPYSGAIAELATDGQLGLNNGGDTITLAIGGVTLDSVTYGSEGGNDQAVVRDPELTGTFVQHTTATGAGGTAFSPGASTNGFGH